jgi:hypothetical protein
VAGVRDGNLAGGRLAAAARLGGGPAAVVPWRRLHSGGGGPATAVLRGLLYNVRRSCGGGQGPAPLCNTQRSRLYWRKAFPARRRSAKKQGWPEAALEAPQVCGNFCALWPLMSNRARHWGSVILELMMTTWHPVLIQEVGLLSQGYTSQLLGGIKRYSPPLRRPTATRSCYGIGSSIAMI